MKTKLFLLSFLFSVFANAQAPNWAWADGSGGGMLDHYGTSISTDANGNSYVTGYFQAPFIIFGNDTLTASTNYHDNMFVVKYDNSGNVVWAKSAGGENNCQGKSICCDANGNCYVTGYFHGTNVIVFGNDTLTNSGVTNVFVVKYDAAGNPVWAQTSAPSNSWTDGTGISIDGSGNVYVTGTFSDGPVTFGSTTLNNTSFISDDIFIVKFDTQGNVVWAKGAGGTSNDLATGIATDSKGNSYLTGYFMSASMTFSSTTITNAAGGWIIYVAKYDSLGNVVWAKGDGGTASLYKPAISIDGNGNSYITGYFNGASATFGTTTLNNFGINDIFVVKYNNSGNFVWAVRAGGLDFDEGHSICTDANGNSYITGIFKGTITLGTFTFTTFTSAGNTDIYVTKYDSTGAVVWAKNVTNGAYSDQGMGISVSHGCAYVTGHFFSPTLGFGNTTVNNVDPSANYSNVFVAKIDSNFVNGVNEINSENQVSIFPNPSSGKFVIRDNGGYGDWKKVEIYNTLGEKIYSTSEFNGQQLSIDLSSQPNGIYLVQIQLRRGIISKKIIVADK